VSAAAGVQVRRAVQSWLRASRAGRLLLSWLAMLYIAARRRRRCRVRAVGGHWVHEWSTGVVTDLIMTSRPPEDWDVDTRDVALHRYVPSRGDTVIDVGAGVGHETRLLSQLVGPTGRVIAIEANPRVHACLADMVERNRLANVTCVPLAVGDHVGTVTFADSDDHLGNAATSGGTVEVASTTLDRLAVELGLERIDFVKMNIEGAEAAALRGMADALGRARSVCISCHDFLADAGADPAVRTKAAVTALLEGAGFALTTRDDARPWIADYVYGERDR
jgi:FkbM family methyltransferase